MCLYVSVFLNLVRIIGFHALFTRYVHPPITSALPIPPCTQTHLVHTCSLSHKYVVHCFHSDNNNDNDNDNNNDHSRSVEHLIS